MVEKIRKYWVMKTIKMVLVLVLVGCFGINVNSSPKVVNNADTIPGYRTEFNIPYCTVDGDTLTLNAFIPTDTKAPAPAMIDIHGGWWFTGEPATTISNVFTSKGIAVFSIQYRLGKEGGFPENIRDCRNAVRFVRKNATRFNIDTDRIGCMGGSAGGHLSLMVAMVPEDFNDGGPTPELKGISAHVCNCFSNVAPTDLLRFWNQGPDDIVKTSNGKNTYRDADPNIPNDSRPRLRILFHGVVPDTKEHTRLYLEMSPIGHVSKDVSPLLICDGEKDPIVPGLEGKELQEELQKTGARSTYWMTPGGGHTDPGGKGFDDVLDNFLDSTLKINSSMKQAGETSKFECPFQDTSLSFEERVNDLVGRMTLEEKISQMMNSAAAIPRLGVPEYNWWNECLHGVARTSYKVTSYPQAIAMAACFDPVSMHMMGGYTSEEGRAINNESIRNNKRKIYLGLTYWTPNINIFRDPRWGRGQETYGEDPYLTGTIGKAFVTGLQGDDPKYLKAAACAKHFAIHSGPESLRHQFDAEISDYDLWDTYLPAFQELVEKAKVAGVMCAYNAYENQPCCGNDVLMTDILRNDWDFKGYVTSDCGAIADFYQGHKSDPDAASAAAKAVLHGTDLNCGDTYLALAEAVTKGLITEEQIDESVKRLFMIRFRLGMFDPPKMVPYSNISLDALESQPHKDLALKLARESIVLLKNENHALPLSKKLKKIAILGPNADNRITPLANYNGFPSKIITALDGIKDKLGNGTQLYYAPVTGFTSLADSVSIKSVMDSIQDADAIIYVGGISPTLEGEEMQVNKPGFEGGDRTTILLPKVQTEFLKTLQATGKPIVFVLMSGSAVSIPWESEHIPAIIYAWYGGQASGQAVADVLFGDYDPAGRLPVTVYRSDSDLPPFQDYSMTNRTYRYFKGKALYPFGYGLSYTDFAYQWKNKPQNSYTTNDTMSFSVEIKNTGKMDGDEVVQAYIQYPEGNKLPLKELRDFKRINLSENQSQIVLMKIPVAELRKFDVSSGEMGLFKGKYNLFVGGSSEDRRLITEFEIE
ncbi:MAG: glycoside hydrolase family 3 C-terminal domain-containing protein [Candidatus Kryptoniota bacterium]